MKKLRVLALGFLVIATAAALAAHAPKQPVFFFDAWKALDGKPDAVKELVENAILNLLDSVTNIESMDLRFDISKRLPLDEPITQAEAAAIASRIFDVEADIIKRYPLMASTFEDFKCELDIKFEKEKAEKPVLFDYSKLCGYFYFMQEFFRKNAGYTLFDNPDPLHAMTKGEFIKFLIRAFSLYSKASRFDRGVDYVKVANELENRLRREYKIDVPNVGYVTAFEFMFLTKEMPKVYAEDPEPLASVTDGNEYDKLIPIIKLPIFSDGKMLGVKDPAPRWWAYGLTYYVFSLDMKLADENPFWLSPSAPSQPKVAYTGVDGYTGFKDLSFVCMVPDEDLKFLKENYSENLLKILKLRKECEGGLTFNLLSDEQRRELAMLYFALAIVTDDNKYLEEYSRVSYGIDSFGRPDFEAIAKEYDNKARQLYVLVKKALNEGDKPKAEFLKRKMANYIIAYLVFDKALKVKKWPSLPSPSEKVQYEDVIPVREFHDITAYKKDKDVIDIYNNDRLNKQLNARFVPESKLPNRFKTKFEYYGLKGFEPLEFYLPRYKKLEKANMIPSENYKEALSEEPLAWVIEGQRNGTQGKLILLDNSIIIDRLGYLITIDSEKYKYFDEYRKKFGSERSSFRDFAEYLRKIPYKVPEVKTSERKPVDDPRDVTISASPLKPNEDLFVAVPVNVTDEMKSKDDFVGAKGWYEFLEGYFYYKIHPYEAGENLVSVEIEPVEKNMKIFKITLKRPGYSTLFNNKEVLLDKIFGGAIIGVEDNIGTISNLYKLIVEIVAGVVADSAFRLWCEECRKFKESEIFPMEVLLKFPNTDFEMQVSFLLLNFKDIAEEIISDLYKEFQSELKEKAYEVFGGEIAELLKELKEELENMVFEILGNIGPNQVKHIVEKILISVKQEKNSELRLKVAFNALKQAVEDVLGKEGVAEVLKHENKKKFMSYLGKIVNTIKIIEILGKAMKQIPEGVQKAFRALRDYLSDNLDDESVEKLMDTKARIISTFDDKYNKEIRPKIKEFIEQYYYSGLKPIRISIKLSAGSKEERERVKTFHVISFFGLLDILNEQLSEIKINSRFIYHFEREEKKLYPAGVVYSNLKIRFMPTLDRLNYNKNYGKAATLKSIKEFIDNYGEFRELVENDTENILGYWKDVASKLEEMGASSDSPIVAKLVIDGLADEEKIRIEKYIDWTDKQTCKILIQPSPSSLNFEYKGALYAVKMPVKMLETEFYTESEGASPALSINKDKKMVAFVNIIDYDPTAIEPDIIIGENTLSDEALNIINIIQEIKARYRELSEKVFSGRQILASAADLSNPKFISEKLYDKRHTLRSLQLWLNEGGKRTILDEIYRIRK